MFKLNKFIGNILPDALSDKLRINRQHKRAQYEQMSREELLDALAYNAARTEAIEQGIQLIWECVAASNVIDACMAESLNNLIKGKPAQLVELPTVEDIESQLNQE